MKQMCILLIMKKQMLLYQSPSSGNKSLSVNQMLPSMCPLNRNSCLSLPKKTPLSLLLWWPLKVIFFQVPFRGYDCVLRKSGVSPDWPIRTNEISRMDLASMFTLSYLNHLFFPLLNHSFSNTSFLKKQTKNLLPLPCVPLQLLPHFSIPLHSKTSERADVTSVA